MCVCVFVCVYVDAKGSLATVAFHAASMSVALPFSYRSTFSLRRCLPPSPILDLTTSLSCRPHAHQIHLILRMIQILQILLRRRDLPAVSAAPSWVSLGTGCGLVSWAHIVDLYSPQSS